METNDVKLDLRDLPAQEVQDLLVGLGEKPFRARQVLNWLYKQGANSIEEMTDLSKGLRERLSQAASLRRMEPARVETSQDGTRKLLFELADGARVESVLIPEADHHTLCVSSQAGCRQGCRFLPRPPGWLFQRRISNPAGQSRGSRQFLPGYPGGPPFPGILPARP